MADADAGIGGRYRLDRQLASGGMGTVWQGWDLRLQRAVAVKKLYVSPGLTKAERDVAVERAMREARITARLHHPNAVQVFDVVDEGGSPCLIMQYVPSRSLQEILREDGPLSPAEVGRIGTQVAAALAAAHRAGIVHRDVKPGNVLIAEDGTAKITDFGISHAFDDITLTSTGMVTGTPAYIAPEVARGANSDFASDVYSLGATLYTAVEGNPPFGTDQNPMAVLHRVASGQPEPPTRSGPLTPMLKTMMSPDAASRPSMVDVANTLPDLQSVSYAPTSSTTQVMTHQRPAPPGAAPVTPENTRAFSAPPPPPSVGPPAPRPDDRKRRRSWLPIAAALIVVALGTVLAIVLLSGTGHSNNRAKSPTSHAPALSPTRSTAKASASSSSASSSSPSPSSSAPSPSASTTSATPSSAPTNQQLANAIVAYFNLIPANLDAGWARLTPHFQTTRAQNRQTYDSYWNTIQRVDVSGANGNAPNTASATLTYHYKDGRVVTTQTQFRLVRQNGVLKIDEES
ncbi:MAG TPA: protein kinase [Jatrophihabitans sp.]|jgi:serine/threonine protein kinase